MIAEIFPPARDLATKSDLKSVKSDLELQIIGLRGEIKALPTMRWMIACFLPVWLGAWATVVAIVLKG